MTRREAVRYTGGERQTGVRLREVIGKAAAWIGAAARRTARVAAAVLVLAGQPLEAMPGWTAAGEPSLSAPQGQAHAAAESRHPALVKLEARRGWGAAMPATGDAPVLPAAPPPCVAAFDVCRAAPDGRPAPVPDTLGHLPDTTGPPAA